MLNNFTGSHQAWIGPTEKVVTRCLNANNLEHRSDCLINDILACTLDVLTEVCIVTWTLARSRIYYLLATNTANSVSPPEGYVYF